MSLPPPMLAQAIQLINRGDYPQAIGLLQNIVAAQPSHFESRLQLAKAYLDWVNIRVQMPLTDIRPDMMSEDVAHYLKLAESQLIELVRMRPSSPHVQGLFAVVHLVYKRPAEAMACLKKALAKDPLNPELLYNLGFSLMELERFAEAAKQFARLAALQPGHGMGWHMLGEATRQGGDPEAALVAYRQAIKLLPDLPQPYGGMALALIMLGRHAEGLAYQKRILVLLPSTDMSASALFYLHYIPGLAAAEVASWHRAFGERFETPLKSAWQPHTNAPDPERPLRVGFVSGDFRRHSVGYFMTDLLPSLKESALELVAYCSGGKHDDLTDRIKPQFAAWRECKSMNDDALAAQIRADGIDILVDLSGHTVDNRLLAFARKPAPVQVAYLGYPDTTGLSAIDYILGDPRMFPAGEETLYVEKPWCLPDTSLCFTPPDLPVEVGPLPAAKNGFITFGCLNKTEKANNDAVIETWARILHAVPGSRLLLQNKPYGDAGIAAHVRSRFAERGIEGDRLELIGKLSWHEHMETYNRVDIALDPFPYNGTTTSVEGLWMGVPLLALKGDRLVSHMGESILHAMGMQEWIASDEADYVAKAVAFASDLPALAAMRAGLRDRLLASPICDAPRFARNLEAAFRGMWRQWCDARANQPS